MIRRWWFRLVYRAVQHGCDTSRGYVSVVATHKPCTSALDLIKGIYVIDVRVPGSGCIGLAVPWRCRQTTAISKVAP